MNARTHSAQTSTAANEPYGMSKQRIEAARYVVLCRLTPALRHHMVRPLQPIELIHGVMSRKLSQPSPDLLELSLQVEKIHGFAKSTVAECLDVGTWVAPEPGMLTTVAGGLTECVGLMATMLSFCGIRLACEGEPPSVNVDRDALRMVLVAAIFEMTDALDEAATLTLNASHDQRERGKACAATHAA